MPRQSPIPPPVAGEVLPAVHLGPTGESSPRSPEGRGISRESRQDAAAFLAAQRLGMTSQQADQLVSGMQAQRRELHDMLQRARGEPTSRETAADRAERHSADVAAARAESTQAVTPAAGTMREERAGHGETVTRQVQMRSKLAAS